MDVLATSDLVVLLCLSCGAGLMLLFAVILMVVWVWMLNDWNKRQKTDSAIYKWVTPKQKRDRLESDMTAVKSLMQAGQTKLLRDYRQSARENIYSLRKEYRF